MNSPAAAPIRVLLADDQALIRSALADLVSHEPGLTVVDQASDGREAHRLALQHRPDIVLMDIRMPVMDGIDATAAICAEPSLTETRIVIVTTFDEDAYLLSALRAGASGFIGKGADPAELMNAIRVVQAGDALLSPRATRTLIDRYLDAPAPTSAPRASPAADALELLTEREREVLRLIARGLSNGDIARELVISPHTAKTHASRVLTKLGARDRAQLVVIAYESGLVRA